MGVLQTVGDLQHDLGRPVGEGRSAFRVVERRPLQELHEKVGDLLQTQCRTPITMFS